MNGTSVISPVSNTLNQLFSQIVESIPKVIAAAIILLIGYITGKVVGWVIRKVLEKMNFEKTIEKTTLGETVSRSGWSITKIISTAASWFIYLFFIVAAVNALQFTQLSEALSSIWLWIPNLIAFIIILVIGSIIADFVGNWIQREVFLQAKQSEWELRVFYIRNNFCDRDNPIANWSWNPEYGNNCSCVGNNCCYCYRTWNSISKCS